MLDWKYGLPERRTTRDWDLAVEVPDWKTFLGLKSALTENGTFRETTVQHRLIHRSGTQVDLVPFGGVEASDGTITWPGEETSMTVLGLREAYANAGPVEVEEGLSLPVVTIPFLVVLKLFAFQDRRRMDDLRDLIFALEHYDKYIDQNRIFDELSDKLEARSLSFDHAGHYLIGKDVGQLCRASTIIRLNSVLDELIDPQDSKLFEILPRGLESDEWETRANNLIAILKSFRDGIADSTNSP
jgi:predicted nucleotidyltransferase